jgi:hypothetical protein
VPGVTKIALSGSTVLVRAPVVTMPNVVGELRASAVGHLQAIGLSVQVSTVPDPDRCCDHVGYVDPLPGRREARVVEHGVRHEPAIRLLPAPHMHAGHLPDVPDPGRADDQRGTHRPIVGHDQVPAPQDSPQLRATPGSRLRA